MKDGPEVEGVKKTVGSATNGGDNNNHGDMRSDKTRNNKVATGEEGPALPLGGPFATALLPAGKRTPAADPSNNPVVVAPDTNGDEGQPGAKTTNTPTNNGKNNDNRDKIFVCGICNRCFGYKHVLQNHERTHTGEKPFECPECHKRFTRDHHLKTHMRLHTGEKPYQCSHCDRHFVQVANLRRHLRVHTGERPYACQICTSRFSDSNQLKAHMLIHRGEKPFQCSECLGRFRRRHHLIHHKCPKDEANLGKPRRGRRPKAYDQLPRSGDEDHLRISDNEEDVLDNHNSSSEQEHPPNAQTLSLGVVHKNRRKPNHTIRILTPQQRELFLRDKVTMQTQAIDMSLSPSSEGPLTVIMPRSSRFIQNSVEGVLDLSSSRSDSEIEPIEEVHDGLDDEEDEGLVEDHEDIEDFDEDSCGGSNHSLPRTRQLSPRIANRRRLIVEPVNGGGRDVHHEDDDSDEVHIHANGGSEHISSDDGREENNRAISLTIKATMATA